MRRQQRFDLNNMFFVLGLMLLGCASDKATLSSVEVKPRLKINQTPPVLEKAQPTKNLRN